MKTYIYPMDLSPNANAEDIPNWCPVLKYEKKTSIKIISFMIQLSERINIAEHPAILKIAGYSENSVETTQTGTN